MSPSKVWALAGLLLLAGCTQPQSTSDDNDGIAQNLSYFKDSKTGLCFAAVKSFGYGGYNTVSITNVPCSAVGK